MNRGRLGALAVVVTVLGLVAYKEAWRTRVSADAQATGPADAGPSIVLVADPREAKCDCPSGRIIRMVREAEKKGVQVRELVPGTVEALALGVKDHPAFLVLDGSGTVTARHEGEQESTVTSVRKELEKILPSAR